jgi:hypothetical protein
LGCCKRKAGAGKAERGAARPKTGLPREGEDLGASTSAAVRKQENAGQGSVPNLGCPPAGCHK